MNKRDIFLRIMKPCGIASCFLSAPILSLIIMKYGFPLYLRIIVCVIISALIFAVFRFRRKQDALHLSVFLLLFFVLSVIRCDTVYQNTAVYARNVYATFGEETHTYGGHVENIAVKAHKGVYITLDAIDGRILKKGITVYAFNATAEELHEGDGITFSGKIVPMKNSARATFDFAKYLSERGIYYKIASQKNFLRDDALTSHTVGRTLRDFFKKRIRSLFAPLISHPRYHKIIATSNALLCGDKISFTEEETTNFRISGITHIFCVSGLHFSVLVSSLAMLFLLLGLSKNLHTLLLAVVSLLFLAMCGFSFSALRAAVMTFGALCGPTKKDVAHATYPLLLACYVICVFQPYAVFDIGFHLSFIACFGILCALRLMSAQYHYTKNKLVLFVVGSFITSLSASIFVLPYSLFRFGGVSTVSVFVSMLTVFPVQLLLSSLWLAMPFSAFPNNLLMHLFRVCYAFLVSFIYRVVDFFSSFDTSFVALSLPDYSLYVFIIMLIICAFLISSRRLSALFHRYYVFIGTLCLVLLSAFSFIIS